MTVLTGPVGAAHGFEPTWQICPTVGLPLAVPLTVQLTPVLEVPVTVADKVMLSVVPTVAVEGVACTRTPESSVTVAVAVAVDTAWLVTVMVTVFGLTTEDGAV